MADELIISRRQAIVGSLASFLAAPAIVRASSLMPGSVAATMPPVVRVYSVGDVVAEIYGTDWMGNKVREVVSLSKNGSAYGESINNF